MEILFYFWLIPRFLCKSFFLYCTIISHDFYQDCINLDASIWIQIKKIFNFEFDFLLVWYFFLCLRGSTRALCQVHNFYTLLHFLSDRELRVYQDLTESLILTFFRFSCILQSERKIQAFSIHPGMRMNCATEPFGGGISPES